MSVKRPKPDVMKRLRDVGEVPLAEVSTSLRRSEGRPRTGSDPTSNDFDLDNSIQWVSLYYRNAMGMSDYCLHISKQRRQTILGHHMGQ
jgi:hypothetical protein